MHAWAYRNIPVHLHAPAYPKGFAFVQQAHRIAHLLDHEKTEDSATRPTKKMKTEAA